MCHEIHANRLCKSQRKHVIYCWTICLHFASRVMLLWLNFGNGNIFCKVLKFHYFFNGWFKMQKWDIPHGLDPLHTEQYYEDSGNMITRSTGDDFCVHVFYIEYSYNVLIGGLKVYISNISFVFWTPYFNSYMVGNTSLPYSIRIYGIPVWL